MTQIERNIIYSLPIVSIVFEIIQSIAGDVDKLMAIRDHGIFLVILFFIIKYFNNVVRFNLFLILLFTYFAVLLMLYAERLEQYNFFVRVFDAKMLLPLSFIVTSSFDNIKLINKRMLWVHLMFVISITFFLVLGIGEDQYGSGSGFKTGTFTFTKLYIGSFLLVLSPLIYSELRGEIKRNLYMILGVLTFIILILSVRRTAIVIVLIGTIIFIYYNRNYISKIVFYFVIFITVILISFPLYQDIIIKQLSARSKEFLSDKSQLEVLQGEMRYFESIAVWKERLLNPELEVMLFGDHLFDSKGHYANGVLGSRPIHLDINTVLHGSGVVGLILFLGFYVQLYATFLRYKIQVDFKDNKLLIYCFNGVYFSHLFLLLSGGLNTVTYNMITALYMGGILGYFRSLISLNLVNKSILYSTKNDKLGYSIQENFRNSFLYLTKKKLNEKNVH